MATRQVIVLWVYEPNGRVFTKHVVAHGWNAVEAVNLIRDQWKGIWDETGENFCPWHSIYKIEQHLEEEEVSDGKATEESGIHGGGQAGTKHPGSGSTEGLSGSARLQGSAVAHS